MMIDLTNTFWNQILLKTLKTSYKKVSNLKWKRKQKILLLRAI